MTADAPRSTVVLVVEDDPAIREGLVDALGFQGHRVLQATTAPAGTEAALRSHCDLVLLDLMLPGGDGLDVLKELRRLKPRLPVIIITARGREADRVRGLRMGADDYVVKPFSVRELLARVDAVLRRSATSSPAPEPDVTRWPIPGGHIDLARREVCFHDGAREELSEREQALLAHLAHHTRRAVGRDELLRAVWGMDPSRVQTRTVDMHVARLRDKLRDGDAQVILTVRGKGYMLGELAPPGPLGEESTP
jgi:two-component system, OmpR family, alkaline phosphatase synthesis response regulator PhoP